MKRIVADVMTRVVVSCEETSSFREIVERMQEHRVSALPVVDPGGRLIGIVSEADLLPKEGLTGADREHHLIESARRQSERTKAAASLARELMSSPVVTATPDMSLGRAARLMYRHSLKRLPVVDEGGRIVGIVSRSDLLRLFVREDREIRREIERDVVEGMLWIEPGRVVATVRDGMAALAGLVERKSQIPALEHFTQTVPGVVEVSVEGVDYEFDDTDIRPEGAEAWGVLPHFLRT